VNLSLSEGFEQRVEHLFHYNILYDESMNAYKFEVYYNKSFEGFFLSRVIVCSKPLNESLGLIKTSLLDPRMRTPGETIIPRDVNESFVASPNPKVVEAVVPAYESWFNQQYGFSPSNATRIGLASTAALFVYNVYIKYDPGAVPKTIEEVVETRRGDCDDMSRVLVELLNFYDIPAALVSGYVYIKEFKYNITVENVTYYYLNNGPHAFAVAYIPGYGWLSLDLLAGSFLLNPIIVEGYTRNTSVSSEKIEEFLDLHRALKAKQAIAILSESEFKETIGVTLEPSKIYEFFNKLLGEQSANITTSASTSTTTIEKTINYTTVYGDITQTTTSNSLVISSELVTNSTIEQISRDWVTVPVILLIVCLIVLAFTGMMFLHRTKSMR
jgi:Transglutaminase-like enzymes, putative cysteine proteases